MNMYKKLTTTVLLFYFSLNAFTQVEVMGHVLLYEDKSQGIESVIILKIDIGVRGQSDTTDSKGAFKVKFPGEFDRKQGRLKVFPPATGSYKNHIVMEVDGYHYVKDIINLTVGRIEGVKISLCSPETFKAMVEKLAKPYIDEVLRAERKRIDELIKENERLNRTEAEGRKLLQYIEIEYKILRNNYIELAEKFARVDPELADENLRKAREYFENGDIENAKKSLPNFEQAKNDVVRGKMIMSLHISFAKTEGNIYDVQQKYEEILDHVGKKNDRFKLLIDYSEYLFQNRIFDTTNTFVNIAFKKAEEANLLYELPLSDKIYSYNLLGKIQKEQSVAGYYTNYETAIDIFKNHKKDALDYYVIKKNIAISYHQLANYYNSKKKYQLAEDNYKKAEDIYILLRESDNHDNKNHLYLLLDLATYYSTFRKKDLVKQCNRRVDLLLQNISDEEERVKISIKQGDLALVSGDTTSQFISNLADAIWHKYPPATSSSYFYYIYPYYYYLSKYNENPLYKNDLIKVSLKMAYTNQYNNAEAISLCDSIIKNIGNDTVAYKKEIVLTEALRGYKLNFQSTETYRNAKETARKTKNKDLKKMVRKVKKDNAEFIKNGYVYFENIDSITSEKALTEASLGFELKQQSKNVFEKAEYLAKNTQNTDLIKFVGQVKNYDKKTFWGGLVKSSLPVLSWGALYALFLITL